MSPRPILAPKRRIGIENHQISAGQTKEENAGDNDVGASAHNALRLKF